MAGEHPKVPGTPANFEKDHQDKMKLNAAFEQFKELVEEEAKTSPDVRKVDRSHVKTGKGDHHRGPWQAFHSSETRQETAVIAGERYPGLSS